MEISVLWSSIVLQDLLNSSRSKFSMVTRNLGYNVELLKFDFIFKRWTLLSVVMTKLSLLLVVTLN